MTVFPSYPLHPKLTGFGYLGFVDNPDKDYKTYSVGWPGFAFHPNRWFQLWLGVRGFYTDNEGAKANTLELRPFVGVKLFVRRHAGLSLYSFSRYEYRATKNLESHDWTYVNRFRFRFGAEVPIASGGRGWKPRSFYALADVEPSYRSDGADWDPVRLRAGVGYVAVDHIRAEVIYTMSFTRPDANGGLEHTDNTFRLNFKLGLKHGVLPRILDGDVDQ